MINHNTKTHNAIKTTLNACSEMSPKIIVLTKGINCKHAKPTQHKKTQDHLPTKCHASMIAFSTMSSFSYKCLSTYLPIVTFPFTFNTSILTQKTKKVNIFSTNFAQNIKLFILRAQIYAILVLSFTHYNITRERCQRFEKIYTEFSRRCL